MALKQHAGAQEVVGIESTTEPFDEKDYRTGEAGGTGVGEEIAEIDWEGKE